jgi:fimbrial chaperone protein
MIKTRRYFSFIFVCLVSLAGMTRSVLAANLNITPVRVELSGQRPYSVIQITNVSTEPVTLQARVFKWGFQGEQEDLTATDDLILNPPLVKLAPKAQQFVRLGLRKPNTENIERTYRLLLEELPPNSPESGTVVRTLLRVSIPVFAESRVKTASKIVWTVTRNPQGKLDLTAVNNGTAHVQIRTLTVRDEKNPAHKLTTTIPVYLLQAQGHRWPLDGFDEVTSVQLEASTDAGDEQTVVQAEGR